MTIDIPISHSKDSGRVLSCPPSNQITDPCWLTPPSRMCGMVQLRISWNINWPVCTMRLRQWKCWNMASMCWQWPSLQRFAKISWLRLPQNSALTVACKILKSIGPRRWIPRWAAAWNWTLVPTKPQICQPLLLFITLGWSYEKSWSQQKTVTCKLRWCVAIIQYPKKQKKPSLPNFSEVMKKKLWPRKQQDSKMQTTVVSPQHLKKIHRQRKQSVGKNLNKRRGQNNE